MTTTTASTPVQIIPAEPENTVALEGELFGKDVVMLPGDDDSQREMGVLWVKDETGKLRRVTDFSGMHRDLHEGSKVKLAVSLSVQARQDQPAKEHRNLVSVLPVG